MAHADGRTSYSFHRAEDGIEVAPGTGPEVLPAHGKEAISSHGMDTASMNGLEAVNADNRSSLPSQGLEVMGAEEKELRKASPSGPDGPQVIDSYPPETVEHDHRQEDADGSPQHVRKRWRWLWMAAIAILLLVIGLGVGLGVSLNGDSAASSDPTAADGSQYYSTSGAFNGSGIATGDVYTSTNLSSAHPIDNSGYGGRFVFFQHYTGQIRWMYQNGPSDVSGGSMYDVVAINAKNGTPITARSYQSDGIGTWHVFYIDHDNYLRQCTINETSHAWSDGLLNDLNLKVFDSDRVGLTAVAYQGPIPGFVKPDENVTFGTWLFIATSQTKFEQLAWYPGLSNWVRVKTWSGLNGHASPTFRGWGKGHTYYLWFVNEANTIATYWNDMSNISSTETHPTNEWVPISLPFPSVDPSMGLGYKDLLYAKLQTGELYGWNITTDAEDSSISTTSLADPEIPPPTDRSQIEIISIPDRGKGPLQQIIIFYQTEGDDITMSTGTLSTGQWFTSKLVSG